MINYKKPYLVKIQDAWIDVYGKVHDGILHWVDRRDGSRGESLEFIEHCPRELSKAERGIKDD